ncbi:MAG: 2-isopropylmalate synthase [Deltaproteobacteria bacterium]|nr:2-isopropylmalate synthase [Deltaproteobacteria bacterium]
MNRKRKIEVLDTTIRDGEQMHNVSFMTAEKVLLTQMLLEDVRVDRVEITSARSSYGEAITASSIYEWASENGYLDRIEVLGFIDHNKSSDWISDLGGKVINLLAKGSLNHVVKQLRKTPEAHIEDIRRTVEHALSRGLTVNLYLEDWSNGFRHSRDFVHALLDSVRGYPIAHYMLCDTLGILFPSEVKVFVEEIKARYQSALIDLHCHNDYGLATANCLFGVMGGADGLHLTVNGMGERAGNAALEEIVVGLKDFVPDVYCNANEKALYPVSKKVELFSRQRMAVNKPICGDNAFTHTSGIHTDGDLKGNLYRAKITPERFGREVNYTLSKLSGKASLEYNLNKLGIDLTDEEKGKVLARIIQMSHDKEPISVDALPKLVDLVLKGFKN